MVVRLTEIFTISLHFWGIKSRIKTTAQIIFESIKRVQKAGMEVMGGFIVGFDSDLPTIFKQQIVFLQKSGIDSPMIGMLNAPTKSKLNQKLHLQGRILDKWTGDNTDSSTNIIPKINISDLKPG